MTPQKPPRPFHAYLVRSDYYHRPTQLSATHTALQLFSLAEAGPRIVGVATIEPYSELDARRDLTTVFAAASLSPAVAS